MTKQTTTSPRRVDAVIFDFGGVLAEEGFFDGFTHLAAEQGLDARVLGDAAADQARAGGYCEGRADEAAFWNGLRAATGLAGSDAELRRELLTRFVPRPWMFAYVDKLRAAGYKVAILSDQTNWLEELDEEHDVFSHFDLVWNSWRTGRTKKEPQLFMDMAAALGAPVERVLFVDDHGGHIRRAQALGMPSIHYTGREDFERRFADYCPL